MSSERVVMLAEAYNRKQAIMLLVFDSFDKVVIHGKIDKVDTVGRRLYVGGVWTSVDDLMDVEAGSEQA